MAHGALTPIIGLVLRIRPAVSLERLVATQLAVDDETLELGLERLDTAFGRG
jgi:hypothetical protein